MLVCVRCGNNRRDHNTYLCYDCRVDPATEEEVYDAHRATVKTRGARRWLVDNRRWYGHWQGRPRETISTPANVEPAAEPDEAVAAGPGRQGVARTARLHPQT